MTWVIKAEHTGAFPGNPSFAWIKRKFYIFLHRLPAPILPTVMSATKMRRFYVSATSATFVALVWHQK